MRPTIISVVGLLALGAAWLALSIQEDFANLQSWKHKLQEQPWQKQAAVLGGLAFLVFYASWGFLRDPTKTLLIDVHCFKVPDRLKHSRKALIEGMRARKAMPEENIAFHEVVLERSGLGDETGLTDGIVAMKDGPIQTTLEITLEESKMVIFDVVEQLLAKTNTSPSEIGIVMVSCSCFAPTPSMAAMLVNRFKMRTGVLTYSFAGMGCASSLVCVDLAKHMLRSLPNTMCLIVNHENITANWYSGNNRSMMVTNCLFRLGGAAVLLSNRLLDRRRAKYELVTSLRTHLGNQDDAFGCMGVAEDADGIKGIFLRKQIVEVAGRSLRMNITALAPQVLPYLELAKCVLDKSYQPDFSKAFQHFLLHTGGRGIVDELEHNLRLTSEQVQPSRDALARFGNTSAASTWYILTCIEHKHGVRKGDRVWQLGSGGGFKCNSAVWKARKMIKQQHSCWV